MGRENRDHARRLLRRPDADALYPRVRVRAADDRHVKHAGLGEVVRITAVTGDQTRVFAAMDLGAYELGDGHLVTSRGHGRLRLGRGLGTAHRPGRGLHGLDDVHVARTPAEVAFQAL